LKKFIIIFLFFASATAFSQEGSYAGGFARLGFGARGMGMGNAMVSNIFGDVSGYYNPALACFQDKGVVNLGYTFLSMDRKLNFVGFSKKFKLPNQSQGGAGISFSLINSGVNNIDGRDNDGTQIGTFTTYENQFYLGTSFLLSENFAAGVGFKMYLSKLFDKVTTTSVAFDIGAVYKYSDKLAFGIAVKDISAKYKWDTSDLYGSNGNTTEDKFPTLANIGASYLLPKNLGSVSLEFESYFNPKVTDKTTGIAGTRKNISYFKVGGEIILNEYLKVRAGMDRIDFANKTEDIGGNLKPSFGVGFVKPLGKSTMLGLDYSFQFEPYSKDPIQNIGINFKFN
jgi:hypothetical protein